MKLRKTLAVLSAIAAGSTMIFGQAVSVQAEDVVIEETSVSSEVAPAEEAAAPVEEAAAPAEEAAAPVEEAAAPVEGTTTPADEIETVGTVTTVAVDSMYDEYATQTTTVAVAVEGTTTTTVPYLDTTIYNAVDVNSDAGKAQVADKSIDYDKVYNDFLYNVVVPNTEGGISSVTESSGEHETVKVDGSSGDSIAVYNEMLGIFAATVHDFCNDSIPELLTVTNTLDRSSVNMADWVGVTSTIVYDIWQYNKADDTIHKVSTIDSITNLPIRDFAFGYGKESISASITGNTIVEEGTYISGADPGRGHAYIMYKVDDDYSFRNPCSITANWANDTQSPTGKNNGAIYGVLFDNDGSIISQVKGENAEDVKAAFEAYGVDADVDVNFGSQTINLQLSNIKDKKALYDYTVEQKDGMHYNLIDYTGVHGKTSSAPASTNGKTGNESAKAANKNDSPKTGVAFPIAAAGTGAAALALAAAAVVSKKKKD